MTESVVVVGAGHNGLVCATYLAKAGMTVTLLEVRKDVGGLAAGREFCEGYRVPSFAPFTYPLSTEIRKDLQLDNHGYLPGAAIDTALFCDDGRHVNFNRSGVDGEDVSVADSSSFLALKKQYFGFAESMRPLFEHRPPRLKNMDRADKISLAKLGWNIRFGLGRDVMNEFLRVAAMNIYDVLDEAFEDERIKAAIAVDAVMGNAMGPRSPGSVLTWLNRLYAESAGPLSVNSSSAIAALEAAARAASVTIQCDTEVTRILVDDERVSGVELASGETLKANVVMSNIDPVSTFKNLVGSRQLDAMFANRVSQIRCKGVVGKLHVALEGPPQFKDLKLPENGARVMYAPSMRYVERAFNASKYGECSEEPVLEVSVPSLADPSLAPEGHHVLSANVAYLPYQVTSGWQAVKPDVEKRLVSTLARMAPGIESQIVASELVTPADINDEYGITGGHWHHVEQTIHQSFMMRPLYGAAQYNTPIDGLFLCGSGCHPGGGVTGLPGKNAAKRVLELQ